MSADFLLELRCEEIPARMQAGARRDLEKLFRDQMLATGVSHGEVTVYSTPRRLALIARDLPERTEAVREEFKGPRVGAPPQALEGFLRKVGLREDQLEDRGGVWFAMVERPGRETTEVLTWAIASICRGFPWPKSMRWGAASLSTESLRWVRPLSGILAFLGEEAIGVDVGGVQSAYQTLGHRFHHPGAITIGGAHDYVEKLRACHVLVDHAEREAIVREMARAAALSAGLTLVEDEGLVIENAGLTEWPVPLLGRFDEAFLDVPPEVIQLTARVNQKYFVCTDSAGKLANAFVCTANIEAADGGAAIVDGNRKVLAARLSDARFFWDQDRKTPLADQAKKLERITFHEKLGTVADKVKRVAKLARWLAEEGIVKGADPDQAEQAARLAKADLVTEMVGEFPELQGLMGGYYARAEGLPEAVADAIRDHYKPVGQGDEVPTAPVTVAVSLADKLDTLFSLMLADELPTGSKDPFALRRQALGVIGVLTSSGARLPLQSICQSLAASIAHNVMRHRYRMLTGEIDIYFDALNSKQPVQIDETGAPFRIQENGMGRILYADPMAGTIVESYKFHQELLEKTPVVMTFLADRLKVQQREAGVRHDLIDAVFALGGEDDLVRLLARVHALQAFMATDHGANLLAGYKRAANILKKEGVEAGGEKKQLSYTAEPDEAALIAALDAAEPRATSAVEAEDFAGAMAALASLRGPIDAFFTTVTVNDADPAKRDFRLALLDRFRAAVHKVADFSRIEG